MPGDIVRQEIEELAQYRIVLGCLCAGEYHPSIRPNRVMDLVTFFQAQGAAHGFGNRGLVAIGQCDCISTLMSGQATPTNTGTFTWSITLALIDGSSSRPSRDRWR